MRFTVNKSDIREVLSKIQGLTGRRTNLAITETVRLRAKEGEVILTATDLETGFEGIYPANVDTEGTIAINAKKFYEIIREFPTLQIAIHEEENRWIKIGNGNIEYHIVGMDPEEFPDTPEIEDVEFREIDAGAFKSMIERTVVVAGSPDDKRAHINGLFFEIVEPEASDSSDSSKASGSEGITAKIVSTDGSRLSTAAYPYASESDISPMDSLLIPKKGMNEVAKFLGGEGAAQLGQMENHFIVKRGTETLTIRLLEGDFPKYQSIISRTGGRQILMDRQTFLMMLRRMSILSSDTYKGVIFTFGNDRLTVVATNPDIGESKEDMEIEYEGDPMEIAFNPKFFIEALNMIDEERVTLDILDEKHPCFVRGEGDETYLSVIMPMRI